MITHYVLQGNILVDFCLQPFRISDALKSQIKKCFKVNRKQRIKIPKKGKYVRFKNFERKIKSPFRIFIQLFKVI